MYYEEYQKVIMSAIIIIAIFCLGVTSYGFSVGDMTGKDPSNDAQNSINNLGQGVIKNNKYSWYNNISCIFNYTWNKIYDR